MRLYDWQARLAAFAKERADMPFEWGRNDCTLFAADAVLAMTGVDHAAGWRGYDNIRDAQRLIDELGGLRAIATAALGDAVPVLMAAPGDVLLLDNGGRELLAICNGTSAIAPWEKGLAALPMSQALAAWKV